VGVEGGIVRKRTERFFEATVRWAAMDDEEAERFFMLEAGAE
jgi:non-canonical (house-cleaning) NTP pyrophosphatase